LSSLLQQFMKAQSRLYKNARNPETLHL